ncbi:hypothetical protein DSO57_1025387 [Entomophthora muscae]|uniref:Uncharacterized protein n=1 Tax=Entomophthora muscae TaxID=34485 RepID=A0ACC2S496_9FUNG|nr:hypothetical protein DSO57_1025387 [Entomophthora muscae]
MSISNHMLLAGAVALCYYVYVRYFKVPASISNLPAPPALASLYSFITQPNLTRVRNYYFPLLHKYGLMRVSPIVCFD